MVGAGPLPSAGHSTRHAASQRDPGAKATETGESVTRRKEQETRGIGQSAEPHTSHRHATRNAGWRQALYNIGVNGSMETACCDSREWA